MKKIIIFSSILVSSNAHACSFFLERSSAYPKLVSATIIIGISLWLLMRCYPAKKKPTLILITALEATPLFFIIKNWNKFDICASKVILPAYVALVIAIVVLLVSLSCVLWKYFNTRHSELTD